jgi:hypothetical protein
MSRNLVRTATTLLALSTPWLFIPAAHALCEDPAGDCAGTPCPAEYSCCLPDDVCPPGSDCVHYPADCWPSYCYCDSGAWACTGDCCQHQCDVEVPAASERGLLALALLLVTFGSFVVLWRGGQRREPGGNKGPRDPAQV